MVSRTRRSAPLHKGSGYWWHSEALHKRTGKGGPHTRAGGRASGGKRTTLLWVETKSEEIPEDCAAKSGESLKYWGCMRKTAGGCFAWNIRETRSDALSPRLWAGVVIAPHSEVR